MSKGGLKLLEGRKDRKRGGLREVERRVRRPCMKVQGALIG